MVQVSLSRLVDRELLFYDSDAGYLPKRTIQTSTSENLVYDIKILNIFLEVFIDLMQYSLMHSSFRIPTPSNWEIRGGEFTLISFPARRGFHCISLTVKVNAPGISQLGVGKGVQMTSV